MFSLGIWNGVSQIPSESIDLSFVSFCLNLMISKETFKEFQEVVNKELGITLDDKDTKKVLNGLVNYFDLLAKINYRKER